MKWVGLGSRVGLGGTQITHFNSVFILCVCVLVCVYITCVACVEAREHVGTLRTVITDGCEALCSCWEQNYRPLQEQ